MLLKNNLLYESIFGKFAKFLVENTTFKVYYISYEYAILLTSDNYKKYCEIFDSEYENKQLNGWLFMCLGELPLMNVKITYSTDNESKMLIEQKHNSFNYLNWDAIK